MAVFTHKVTKKDEGLELRDIMRRYFDFSSRLRNKIKREKLVTLNGRQTEGWIKPKIGDLIVISLPDEKSGFEPEDIPLYPIFEDDDLLILNKQPGITVHPTKGRPSGTVANALMHYMEQKGESFKIRFINRLDMDTSGLLIVAKNAYCQNDFTRQVKNGSVKKKYIAILCGIIQQDSGIIDLPIGSPDPHSKGRAVMAGGAPSVTHYKVLQRFPETGHTMAELLLKTGRTHQIRVHMSHIGHPVLGDQLYGGKKLPLMERQALHAFSLSFEHPITGERLLLTAPLPHDMESVLKKLK